MMPRDITLPLHYETYGYWKLGTATTFAQSITVSTAALSSTRFSASMRTAANGARFEGIFAHVTAATH